MKELEIKLDLDDISIVPAINTQINSRYKDVTLSNMLPLFTAPMDTVVDLTNFEVFLKNKINVVLPRTVKYEDFLSYCITHNIEVTELSTVFVSFGFEDLDSYYKDDFKSFHKNANILIDVANGHLNKIATYAKQIKKLRPDITIMVGNIANPKTYEWYCKLQCINMIRTNVGTGGGCLTSKNSGINYPLASLIMEIAEIKKKFEKENPDKKAPLIIADGGMKDYADIIKSLSLGADYVMVGSVFNKSFESCAYNYLYGIKLNKNLAKIFFDKGLPIKKYFRGMSTKEVQKAMGKTNIKTSEGVVRFRKVEYHLKGWVENFEHYLRNAMSYTNSKTLKDFIGNVNICRISKKAYDRFNK
jgi:IMP dehydrogenase/GMP reductase